MTPQAGKATKETHKWTPEETRRLIRFRAENEQHFRKSKHSAKQRWEALIKELGLEGKVSCQQASKKWENLKKKYKDLKMPKPASGADADETTAAMWQYFELMHEALGARPSVDPPVVVASFNDEDPTSLLMEIVEPSHSSAASTSSQSTSAASVPGASASPMAASSRAMASSPNPSPPKKRRRTDPILDFLMQEAREDQRRYEESEAKTERFLALFEKLVEKL